MVEQLVRDQNHIPVAGGVSSASATTVLPFKIDSTTGRLLVDSASGSGTVTDVSVATANGFAGTVATSTTTPVITLSTTITGVLKGNGTAISAASPSTDYAAFAFKTISVATQSDVVADSPIDTLTLVAGSGMTITTNATTDTITFASSGSATDIQVGVTTISSGTTTRILYDNAGVLGEYTLTGTGTVVAMAISPAFTTPNIGVATATSVNGLTITASTGVLTIANGKTATHNASTTFAGTDGKTLTISNSGTLAGGDAFVLAIAAGKTLTVSNTLTFTGTDSSSVAFGTGGTVLYTASTIPLTVGSTTIASGTTTRILYDNSGVLGEYTLTGTGTVVVMATSPTFTTGATTPQLLATANDSGALGASGTAFADLFLASGGVINWAANNSNITHSSGILTVGAGEFRITSANVGTNADSVPTLSSTSTLTNKTLTAPVIGGAASLADGATISRIVPTVDGTATGPVTSAFVSGYTSSAIGDLVILDSSGKWQKTDANTSSIYNGLLGIALAVAATDAALKVALPGAIVYATGFPTFTVGGAVYMSETAGAVTQTAPTTTDSATRLVGYGVHADKMFFFPSNDWITHT